MKKNIIIPIVAALMSVVFAVGIAVGIKSYNQIWTDAHAVRGYTFIRENRPEKYEFDLVRSYSELIELCNYYNNYYFKEENSNCDCKKCARLRNYDEKFFEDKALIIIEVGCADYGIRFAIKSLAVTGETLALDLYEIAYGGWQAITTQVIFIEVKKSKVESVTIKKKTIIDKTGALTKQEKEFLARIKIIEVDGEPSWR